jgi:hypothetical protein
MSDKREAILTRLVEIAKTTPGIVVVFRNKDEISDRQRPCIVILDADEAADDGDPSGMPRRPNAPRRVAMTPEFYVMLGAKPEHIGTELNIFRAAILKAVLTDVALASLVGTNGDIRYEGCATALARGRMMEGEMGLSFTFAYVLRPNEL